MKYAAFLLLITLLVGCYAPKTVSMADGSYISERKYDRILKKVYRQTIREMNKEERQIIRGMSIKTE